MELKYRINILKISHQLNGELMLLPLSEFRILRYKVIPDEGFKKVIIQKRRNCVS